MIKNGLLITDKVGYAKFKTHLIPKTNKVARPQYRMFPTYITIHNTGNSKNGANAKNHTEYVDKTTSYLSWHFTVDDKEVYQELPVNETGWHAGDGYGSGNMFSIGIEICEHEGIDWEKAKYNAIQLIIILMKDLNIGLANVVPHKHWSGKYCPRVILDEGWDKFTDLIKKELKLLDRKLTANEILELGTVDKEKWIKGKNAAIKVAKADGDLGDLEIFKFLDELIVKIYYLR